VIAGLVDGLGHGARAAEAATAFATCVRETTELALDDIFGRAHEALRKTRGAVAGLARFDEHAGRVEFGAVGNVVTAFFRPGLPHRILGLSAPGVLGSAYRSVRLQVLPFGVGDTMLMCSDGVQHGGGAEDLPEGDPTVVAAAVVRMRGKNTDDAACVVARGTLNVVSTEPAAPAGGERSLRVCRSGDAECAAHMARVLAGQLGFPPRAQWETSIAVAELATNVLKYAIEGLVQLRHVREPREALVIEVTDSGSGIPDLGAALTDGFSRGRGLGVGLGAVHRMMDDVVVDTVPGRGTRVTATKYAKR